jgi:hypothetical protein
LDEDEVTIIKTAPTIPPMLEKSNRKRQNGRGREDNNSQTSPM